MRVFGSCLSSLFSVLLAWFPLLLFVADICVTLASIWFVPYTEIDWIAYMEEVEGVFEKGQFDYYLLAGQTGPLVYPAGFVYVFGMLRFFTARGVSIRTAQYIFGVLYLLFIAIVLRIYVRELDNTPCSHPMYWLMLVSSRRIHSIFVLRLFNDGIAMLFLYMSLFLAIRRRFAWSSALFSIAVSVKMNVLLFAPGYLLVLLFSLHWREVFLKHILLICGGLQLILGAPFLLRNPIAYIHRAFEISRQFLYEWTVNWKFMSPEAFVSPVFAVSLLLLHLASLIFLLWNFVSRWRQVLESKKMVPFLSSHGIAYLFFVSNFTGIVFSRTLHFQFYVWYFHSIPFLLSTLSISSWMQVGLVAAIELIWNIFPSRAWTSLVLFLLHLIILAKLLKDGPPLHSILLLEKASNSELTSFQLARKYESKECTVQDREQEQKNLRHRKRSER